MSQLKHEINFGNGFVIVPEPKNFDSAEIDIIFDKDKTRASLANLQLVWQGDTAKKIFAVYESGKTGGKGIAHSLPYRITVCGLSLPPFDLMLVMGHSSAKFQCDQVELPAWQAGGADWFDQSTQAAFSHLFTMGIISASDYKQTPYVINSIPNYTQIITISISLFVMIWQLREIILEFTDHAMEIYGGDLPTASVPVAGTPHVAVLVVHIVSMVARVLYIILMIALIFQLAKELKENIFQRKKYKLCMREKDIFLKICQFLGLNFSSSIYAVNGIFENATYMPAKIMMPNISSGILDTVNDTLFHRPENEENPPNTRAFGYPDETIAEWIDKMERKYNARVQIRNGTLYFEEIHTPIVPNSYKLPNTAELGYTFNLPAPFRTNLNELAQYYKIAFQKDESELNTIHRYVGTTAAIAITSAFPYDKYTGWGQQQIIDLGLALAKRKQHTSKVEDFLDTALKVVDGILTVLVGVVNGFIIAINGIIAGISGLITAINALGFNLTAPSPLTQLSSPNALGGFNARIGWMELSNDTFSVPKTFIGTDIGGDWEIEPNSETNMSANMLLQLFHGKNLITRGNQRLIYENNKSRFCCGDFQQILNSNVLVTPDGKQGEFKSMKWLLKKEIANDIQYRVAETYLTGLGEVLVVDETP